LEIYTGTGHRKIISLALATMFAAAIGGLSSIPALAIETGDEHGDRQERGQQERDVHQEREQHGYTARHSHRRYYGDEEPRYVYAPPPVYYAPPERPPVIDFVFPLRFR